MPFGGSRMGSSDPEAFIAEVREIPELSIIELVEFYKAHNATVDALGLKTDLFDPSGTESVTEFSDRIQTRHPSQYDRIEVIDVLSGNGAVYDEDIEKVIETDPLIVALLEVIGRGKNRETLRLRRSLIAIGCLKETSNCAGS